MTDSRIEPVGRVTAIFRAEPMALLCSHCEAEVSDDEAECPRCDSPIDWGASFGALKQWNEGAG